MYERFDVAATSMRVMDKDDNYDYILGRWNNY